MYKIIAVLYFALLVTKGETKFNYSANTNGSLLQNESYVKILQHYDMQMEMLKQPYNASLSIINMQLNILVESVLGMEQFLQVFQNENNINYACVNKYSSLLPTPEYTMSSMSICIYTARSELNQALSAALATRNYLKGNYTFFKKQLENCTTGSSYSWIVASCIKRVNDAAEIYTTKNQRTFNDQMLLAQSLADKSIQKAVNCSFQAQSNVITIMSRVDTLVNNCISGTDCTNCNTGYSCPNVAYLPSYEVDYTGSVIENPFFGRTDVTNCLMLEIVQ